MNKENWEKEFDKNFSGDVKDIKYFISQAIQQERERIIEKLEIWFKEGTEPIEDVIESLK
jgi:hypothetical protein